MGVGVVNKMGGGLPEQIANDGTVTFWHRGDWLEDLFSKRKYDTSSGVDLSKGLYWYCNNIILTPHGDEGLNKLTCEGLRQTTTTNSVPDDVWCKTGGGWYHVYKSSGSSYSTHNFWEYLLLSPAHFTKITDLAMDINPLKYPDGGLHSDGMWCKKTNPFIPDK